MTDTALAEALASREDFEHRLRLERERLARRAAAARVHESGCGPAFRWAAVVAQSERELVGTRLP